MKQSENTILCDILHAVNDLVPGLFNTEGCSSESSFGGFFALFVLVFGLLGLFGGGG